LNLIFCQVEVVPVLAIKPDRIHALAVTEGVLRDALAPEDLGEGLRLLKDLLKVLLGQISLLVPYLADLGLPEERARIVVM
jgi:hypothetical protein